MRLRKVSKTATLLATASLVMCSFQASPEDIDIFTPPIEESNVNRPNVLFVIDNSANWSREAQHWPGETQGESEASAIAQVINELPDDTVNVGILEHITGGSAAEQDSGYVRYHIRPMNSTNKPDITATLKTIQDNINKTEEKRSLGNPFGNLMWDVYQYLSGGVPSVCVPFAVGCDVGVPDALADGDAYDATHTDFASPLTKNDTCTRTIIIFIGNNTEGGPTGDSAENKEELRKKVLAATNNDTDAANAAVAQIPFADYVVTSTTEDVNFGYTSSCYATQAACTTGEAARCAEQGFTNCTCSATAPSACGATYTWTVEASHTTAVGFNTVKEDYEDASSKTYTKGTTYCQKEQPEFACDIPTGVTKTVYDNDPEAGFRTTVTVGWAPGSCEWRNTGTTAACKFPKTNFEPYATQRTTTLIEETKYETNTSNLGSTSLCFASDGECDASHGKDCSAFNGGCSCTTQGSACPASYRYQATGKFNVVEAAQLDTFSAAPTGTSSTYMMDEWARFMRQTGVTVPDIVVNGAPLKAQVTTYTIDVFKDQQDAQFSALLYNAARVGGGKYYRANDRNALVNALREILTEVQAVNSAFSSASLPVNATNRAQNENQVFIGVFKPDKTKDPAWFGNMKRYQLIESGSTIGLGDSLGKPAVNTQTGFIGDCAVSFWTVDSGTYWYTATSDDPDALSICTTNSTSDWSDLPDGPFVEKGAVAQVVRRGNKTGTTIDGNYSVERKVYTVVYDNLAGVAAEGDLQLLTASNAAAGASNAVTDNFTDSYATTDDEQMVRFIRGEDILDEDGDSPKARYNTEPRSTLHGDVVHSRPQPLNYGGDTGVVVFYGANDGHYRAVQAKTGKELWSFVAPESFEKFKRLKENTPIILYYGGSTATGAKPKDYFFDGSTGVYQTDIGAADPETWIFPTLRRGGNRVYALDVEDPAAPVFMWSAGCDSTDCPTEYAAMGQTWSLPNVAFIRGYCGSGTCDADDPLTAANEYLADHKPVIIMGGGYDTCEDQNTWTPACSGATGRGVYVIDAEFGTLVKYFDFSSLSGARSVVSDVALIDAVNDDNMIDYAYAVDTGGNVYRMDFVYDPNHVPADLNDPHQDLPGSALAVSSWRSSRIAYSSGMGHKFLFPPALVQLTKSKIYLAVGSGDREHPLRSHYPYEERDGDDPTKDTDDNNDNIPGNDITNDPGVTNRFYMFKDDLADINSTTVINLNGSCPTGVDAEGKALPPTANCMRDYSASTTCLSDPVLPNDTEAGWFMTLSGTGEQVVTSAVVAAGFVFFSTNRPQTETTDACTTDLGEARGYFMSLVNASGAIGVSGACGGDRSSVFVGGGLPPSPVLATVPIGGADTNGDGVVDINDAGADKNGDGVVNSLDAELRTVVIGAVQKTGEPSSPIQAQRVRPPIASDRKPIYWYKSTGDS